MLEAMRPTSNTPYGSTSWDYDRGTFNRDSFRTDAAAHRAERERRVAAGESLDGFVGPDRNADKYWTGGTGWTYNQTLSPEQQQLYDRGIQSQLLQSTLLDRLTQRSNQTAGQPFNADGLPNMTEGVRDTTPNLGQSTANQIGRYNDQLAGLDSDQFYRRAADAAYRQGSRYLDPQVEAQQKALESRLAEQGFVPGTPAYQQATDTFNQGRERSYADARDRAIMMGTQTGQQVFQNERGTIQDQIQSYLAGQNFRAGENERQFGSQMQSAQFGNQARNQALSEALALRQLPMNELNAFRSGSQITLPNTQAQYNVPQLQNVDRLGAAQQNYQNQLGAYNAGQAGSNNLMSGLFGLGSSYLLSGGNPLAALGGLFGGSGGAGTITGGSGFSF